MIIKQVSVFMENEPGKLEEVTETLLKGNINITALNIAETADYGVLRLVVEDTEAAVKVLREQEFTIKITDVLCIEAPDVPGSLNQVLLALSGAGINISYMYGHSNGGTARFVIKVEEVQEGEAALSKLF